jgi:hypothetical protein
MNQEDLKFVAEALMAMCEGEAKTRPLDEKTLDRKLKESRMRDPVWALAQLKAPGDHLFESECREIVSKAALTDRQEAVLSLRVAGIPFEDIGNRFGGTKQGARVVFIQALKKITRACRVYPYRGLSEVYRWETRRGRA